MKSARTVLAALLCSVPLLAQTPTQNPETPARNPQTPTQTQQKPRIFVTDSDSWSISGGFGGTSDGFGGAQSGGARPQTAEIIKTLGERCKDSTVTINKEKADYILILDHEGGKSFVRKDNKFAIFNKAGDAIRSGSTRNLGNSVEKACEAMMKDWQAQPPRTTTTTN
jgi:hypothetical protein